MSKKLIQQGNTKLGKHMYMFNIPAGNDICNRLCKGCYAHKEQVRFPTVLKARQSRYDASLQLDFSQRVIAELKSLRKAPKFFRIHSSGDFYDQAYVNKWANIAKSLPNITFYAYTKRMKDFDFSTLANLPNVVVINSFHFGGLNYGKIEKAPKSAFVCPDHDPKNQCGITCTWCMEKGKADTQGVFFKQH